MKDALRRSLKVEANARGLEPPPGLFGQVAEDLDSGTHELRELFGDRPPMALVGFDTPGIQDYVFRVRRPVDLFGGSQLVAHFTQDDESREVSIYRHLADGKVAVPASVTVFAGGGGGLLVVAASEAATVVACLERILRDVTHDDLRTVATVLEVWPADLSPAPATLPPGLKDALGPLRSVSRYSATLSALTARRSRERSQKAHFGAPVPSSRHAERCAACNRKVAVKERPVGDNQERVCDSCDARGRYGSDQKRGTNQPQMFEDMVRDLPETPLAVLYADGANVGRAFQGLQSMAQHRALSQAVDGAMTKARDNAIAASPWLAGDAGYRWQVAISGGDDLVLVLPALAVPDVVEPLVKTFEAGFDLEGNTELAQAFGGAAQELRDQIGNFGLGVGIAIADFQFPIQFLVRYARELLKSAKGRIRPCQGERSAADFLVLRSGTPLTERVTDLRRQCFRRDPNGKRPGLWLTRRPLSVGEFVDLVRRTRLLRKHVPPSQVHAMRQEIYRGPELSRSLWRYQHARAKDGEGWAAYRAALGRDLNDVDSLLWTKLAAQAGDTTPWLATDYLDALDLYDLVEQPAKDRGTPT